MAEWENDPPVAVQDWQGDPPAEDWKSDPPVEAHPLVDLSQQMPVPGSPEELARQNFERRQKLYQTPVPPQEGESQSLWRNLTEPFKELVPKLTGKTVADAFDVIAAYVSQNEEKIAGLAEKSRPATTGEKIVAGTQSAIGEAVDAFTSPLGIATLGIGALPKSAQTAVSGLFAAHMASTLPEQTKLAIEAIRAGNAEEAAKHVTGAGLTATFAGLAGKHFVGGTKEILAQRAQEVGPATAAALRTTELEAPKPELEVKEPTPSGKAPEPSVPPATATGEIVKPPEVAQPASGGPSMPISTSKVEISQPTGMGAAVPGEFAQSPKTPTGIKNATVDQERVTRGLPPAMEASRRSYGEVWDRAMAKIDQDPSYPDRLIAELGDKPRALTDLEDATLLHRQVDLQNEYGKATRALAEAFDDGRLEDVALEKVRVATVSDQLLNLYNINKAAGTETARGLAARRMMAYEDFSLAKMELERRAAKGGEQLTEPERAEVVRLNQKIQETQRAYDEYVAKTEQKISALEVKNALTAATQKAQANINPKVMEVAKRIVSNLHREANAARERIKARGLTFGSGPLHEIPNIRDFAIIGADHMVTAGVEFGKWSTKMVSEFGEGIKPHLRAIFDEAEKLLNTIDEKSMLVQPTKRRAPDKQASKLHFEATKAKTEWHEKLQKEQRVRRSFPQKLLGTGAEILNTTRAVITSLDLSAVLRQGGFITLGNPVRAIQAFPSMFKAMLSERGQHAVNLEIANRQNYPLYLRSKLYLSEHGHMLSKMEEAYMSRWADKIPLVAGSQRAYVTFLNRLRADSFDAMANTLARSRELSPLEGETIANFINVATGRGRIGLKDNAAVGLNTVFFAPRYVASRFQLVAGQPLYRGTARTRTAIAKEYARFFAGLATIYGLAQLADGEIETDPRSSDFGKIRFGNTRIDPMAGLQQVTVLLSRLATGETKRLSGKVVPIRGDKVPFGSGDSADVIARFLRTKLSPVVGTGVNVLAGENVVGQPVTPESVAAGLVVPLAFRDIHDAMVEQGIPSGTALAILSIFGMGVQTYEPK